MNTLTERNEEVMERIESQVVELFNQMQANEKRRLQLLVPKSSSAQLGSSGITLEEANLKMAAIEPNYTTGGRHYARLWEVMSLVYKLMKEGKSVTKREREFVES